jgi:hypothetical protein
MLGKLNRKYLIVIFILLVQGCTNTLYQGDLVSTNNLNQQQEFRLWWIKTSLFSKQKGDGSIHLDTGCSRYGFTESDKGLVLVLGADQYQSENDQSGDLLTCAKITNLKRIRDYQQGDLTVETYCTPVDDDFSVGKKTFPKIDMTHRFVIHSKEIDGVQYSPEPLPCQ